MLTFTAEEAAELYRLERDRGLLYQVGFVPNNPTPGPKPRDKKPRLLGPTDLTSMPEFQQLLEAQPLGLPYLSEADRRILTMRSLGDSLKKIARVASTTPEGVKYRLERARKKIREEKGIKHMANISIRLPKGERQALDKKAQKAGVSRSEIIRDAIRLVCEPDRYATVEIPEGRLFWMREAAKGKRHNLEHYLKKGVSLAMRLDGEPWRALYKTALARGLSYDGHCENILLESLGRPEKNVATEDSIREGQEALALIREIDKEYERKAGDVTV